MTVYNIAIRAAEDFHLPDSRHPTATAAERIVLTHWAPAKLHGIQAVSRMLSNKATTYARVDLGRWIVDCPWCKSAQHASREDQRFFCVECGNAAINGQWAQVQWPNEWEDIENLLSARPDKGNQWWTPGETLAGLQAENDTHGVN